MLGASWLQTCWGHHNSLPTPAVCGAHSCVSISPQIVQHSVFPCMHLGLFAVQGAWLGCMWLCSMWLHSVWLCCAPCGCAACGCAALRVAVLRSVWLCCMWLCCAACGCDACSRAVCGCGAHGRTLAAGSAVSALLCSLCQQNCPCGCMPGAKMRFLEASRHAEQKGKWGWEGSPHWLLAERHDF